MLAKKKKRYDDEDDDLESSEDEGDDLGMGFDLDSDSDSEMESEDEFSEETEADTADPELMSAARAAFPDQEWDATRLAALKDFIHLCANKDYDEDSEPDEGEGGLALVFGEPKSKK